jgi:TATA-binding protein-associated factor Taf7
MDVKKKVGDLSNVVIQIHWTRKAILIYNDKTYNAELFGRTDLIEPQGDNFTQYDELTNEQVSNWLDNLNDVTLLNKSLNIIIDNQINLPLVSLPLPWMLNN